MWILILPLKIKKNKIIKLGNEIVIDKYIKKELIKFSFKFKYINPIIKKIINDKKLMVNTDHK